MLFASYKGLMWVVCAHIDRRGHGTETACQYCIRNEGRASLPAPAVRTTPGVSRVGELYHTDQSTVRDACGPQLKANRSPCRLILTSATPLARQPGELICLYR